MKVSHLILSLFLMGFGMKSYAINPDKYVVHQASAESFPLVSKGKIASLLVSEKDFYGVLKVVGHLESDLFKVSDLHPKRINKITDIQDFVVIIGTIGKNEIIDQLVKEGKIDGDQLKGKWEKFTTQIVDNPVKGIKKALVIAGSDKRGTIYGIYDLSNQIGVSPWYFWADVPVQKQSELHVLPGIHSLGEPKVKYRGIFINDEAPALSGWAFEKYGGFNSKFYDKVFELILRMKGNYLWPAMWGRMFYVEDPQNAVLANEYGIVMGTSHHEPLTRAHAEWGKANGKWDFNTNSEALINFWKDGIKRMGDNETIVTVGMRGDGDEPMTEGTAIDLLENIVKTQRNIIADVTKKPAEETPQMWALYKEVQDYYDKGMTVPDDITLLLCDDNWGNIRKLPELNAKPRKGGYGIYYHYDYVGGPRNYKWINTNQIERVWEQMDLAYQYGVDKIWIVNVGDIKPMEFPIEFFLDMAWNPEKFNAGNLDQYYKDWAKENFGDQNTNDIAEILKLHTKYNARRKPELLNEKTYSIASYDEADRVVADYKKLVEKANSINGKLQPEYKDAFYQLVLFPVLASSNLNEMYVATAKNYLYTEQWRLSANDYGEKVKELFEKDNQLTNYYHTQLANDKWNHMMSQTHIGYDNWQQPDKNVIPNTRHLFYNTFISQAIVIEGTKESFDGVLKNKIALMDLTSLENKPTYIDLINSGEKKYAFKITCDYNWIQFSTTEGIVQTEQRVLVNIDWKKAPKGISNREFTVVANNQKFTFLLKTNNINPSKVHGFIESNGYISIEAQNYSKAINLDPVKWTIIPNLGKTKSGVTLKPSNIKPIEISEKSPRLEYDVHFFSKGNVKVHAYFSPTLNFTIRDGLKYGIAFDDEKPQIINFNQDNSEKKWAESVADNIKIITSSHTIEKPGNHVLKFYGIDPALVLQKIVIETESGQILQSYLGPPESFRKK
ncbi:glycosyl hydrolase 115 family protein [Flavobacterium hibernum]|uniref:Glycosyl hydrolase n=1 Tax=Flavobacterium hibernum TaxID=37752 RepID=A0A0D0ET53_9FLAO|nr:glycosyl hydrolase 115 family protein [Flavobacterium hibernum]KIO51668.1 glycosyl hydrolase [Flavobacterium hibernum]OXA83321.1 glycosyl hydrolase [Flavobacterium hibernum]